jgi:hypothetical protein
MLMLTNSRRAVAVSLPDTFALKRMGGTLAPVLSSVRFAVTGCEGPGGANLHLLWFNASIDDDDGPVENLHLSLTRIRCRITPRIELPRQSVEPLAALRDGLFRCGDNDVFDWCELRFRSRFGIKAGDSSAMRAEV